MRQLLADQVDTCFEAGATELIHPQTAAGSAAGELRTWELLGEPAGHR